MRRVLCVWLPTFATDLVMRARFTTAHATPGDARVPAVILTRAIASREVVARRCTTAWQAGVTEEMDLAHARTLLPAGMPLHVESHRPDEDERTLERLARWALRVSPIVAIDPPAGLLIDTTGTERLHRGETGVIRRLAAAIRRMGFAVRIASASTFGTAWAVCHFAGHALARVPDGTEREAISTLPVAALRIDGATIDGLHELGMTRIEHILKSPRSSLLRRFEPLLVHRLQQALGETPEHIDPIRPRPVTRSELHFDGPTDHWESIEAAAHHVVVDLAAQLATLQRGVRCLDLDLLHPHAESGHVRIDLSRPSGSARHLWAILRTHLERVTLREGVEGVVLTAVRTARLRHVQGISEQLGAADASMSHADWNELIDALVARIGPDQVVRIHPRESHLPERAFLQHSVMEALPTNASGGVAPAPRPTHLFRKPQPADVMCLTPDGPIVSLTWRGVQQTVLACRGPERIGPEWWRWDPNAPEPRERDYFAIVCDDGSCLWVCRLVDAGRWYVHGDWS